MQDKVAIVTGAGRGIGLAIATALAGQGCRVALVDVRGEAAEQAAAGLAVQGSDALPLSADVSRGAEVRVMVAAVVARWGRVDILVNNAGIGPTTSLDAISEDEWDAVLGVNLKSVFLCSQAVAPIMRAQAAGKIINIASNAGQMGGLAVGAHYSASKAGVLGLTKALARILAPDVQVNAVAPGTTESEMTRSWQPDAIAGIVRQIPLRRLGKPADTAAAVLFLASDAAGFITGHTLSVNGGLYMA